MPTDVDSSFSSKRPIEVLATMSQRKAFHSTTEVADICNVHRNTIILAIKKGHLRASSTPGGHNRVAHKDLLRFIRERDLPVIAIPGDSEHEEQRRVKVLIVDDDPATVRYLEEALGHDDYDLRTASNGYGAGIETARFNPEVILLDYLLPDVDGSHVFSTLRASEETRGIRVIVITSYENSAALREKFGDDVPVLSKPVAIDELKRQINTVLAMQTPAMA